MGRVITKQVPKIVQIATSGSGNHKLSLFALDDEGNIWVKELYYDKGWERVEDLPETELQQSRSE